MAPAINDRDILIHYARNRERGFTLNEAVRDLRMYRHTARALLAELVEYGELAYMHRRRGGQEVLQISRPMG